MPPKKPAEKPPAESAEAALAVSAKESSKGRRKKPARSDGPAAAAAPNAAPAGARMVARKSAASRSGSSGSGKRRVLKATATKEQQKPPRNPEKDLGKVDKPEKVEESREEPQAKPGNVRDSSEDGDSPARRQQARAVAAAAAAAEASAEEARRATTAAQKVPSMIRELSAEAELQVLLRGSSSGGSIGSAGSNSILQPARMLMLCFSANWCRPCHIFAPKLEVLARRYHRVIFVKLNVDKLPDVADQYKVRAVPTFMLFRRGTLMGSVTSASQVKLEELLIANGAVPLDDEELHSMTHQLQASA